MAEQPSLSSNNPSQKNQKVAPRLPPLLPFALPYLPLEKIFREMSYLDLIKFSFISERCRNLLENHFTVPTELLELKHCERIWLELPGKQPFIYDFKVSREWIEKRNNGRRKYQIWKVWGVEMVMYEEVMRPHEGAFCFYSDGDMDRFYTLFARFLIKVFRTKLTDMRSMLDVEKESVLSILHQSPFPKIRRLDISWSNPNTIDLSELQELLDAADQLSMRVYLPKTK